MEFRWHRAAFAVLLVIAIVVAGIALADIATADLLDGTLGLAAAAMTGLAAFLIRDNVHLAEENERLRAEADRNAGIW